MKLLTILFTLFSLSALANEQYEVKSKIKNVVVYQQGAQIKRQGSYTVRKRNH